MNDQQAELIPFEIVREQEEQTRRVVLAPSRMQLALFTVVGLFLIIGVLALGFVVAIVALIIGIPLFILRSLLAPNSRS